MQSEDVFLCPWADLAVVKLDDEYDLFPDWYSIYAGDDELGAQCEMIGYGQIGEYVNGDWFLIQNSGGSQFSGDNVISVVDTNYFGFPNTRTTIWTDFDGYKNGTTLIDRFGDGGPISTYECQAAFGDSGGALILKDGDAEFLVGILWAAGGPAGGVLGNFGSFTAAATGYRVKIELASAPGFTTWTQVYDGAAGASDTTVSASVSTPSAWMSYNLLYDYAYGRVRITWYPATVDPDGFTARIDKFLVTG